MRVNNDVLALSAGEIQVFFEKEAANSEPGISQIPGQAAEARMAEGSEDNPDTEGSEDTPGYGDMSMTDPVGRQKNAFALGNFEPSYGLTGGKGLSPQGASQNTYDILKLKYLL